MVELTLGCLPENMNVFKSYGDCFLVVLATLLLHSKNINRLPYSYFLMKSHELTHCYSNPLFFLCSKSLKYIALTLEITYAIMQMYVE